MKNWSDLSIPNAHVRTLESPATGAHYQIRVHCPVDPDSAEALPVLFALDGKDLFATLSESVTRLSRRPNATNVMPAIVVTLDRVPSEPNRADPRHLDYTAGPPAEETLPHAVTGGADAFIEFIEGRVFPLIDADFPVDPKRRFLLGHSLAGYFVLHTLIRRPDLFAGFAAISPSIWWNEAHLRAGLNKLSNASIRVLIAVGEWEGPMPPWRAKYDTEKGIVERRKQRAMVSRAQSMAESLVGTLGPGCVAFHLFPDEDHASIVLVAIARTLRFMLGEPVDA